MKLAVEELPPAAAAATVNPTPHTVTRRGRACRCVPRMNTAPRVDQKKDHRKQSKTEQTVQIVQTVKTVEKARTVQETAIVEALSAVAPGPAAAPRSGRAPHRNPPHVRRKA